jgi:integrase
MAGSIMSICSCRSPETGKTYPKGQCPRWSQRGHRHWYAVIDQDKVWDGQRWKRDQLRSPRFATRTEAERWLEGELPAIRAHTAPSVADRAMTVGEYLDSWLHTARKADGTPWRPSTKMTYRGSVENYLRPLVGHLRLIDLHRKNVEDVAEVMRQRVPRLSDRTIHQAFSTLRAALFQAMTDNKITSNPCQRARIPGPGTPEVEVWEPEHVTLFLAHAREAEPRLAPAFQLAAWRGLRRGEICGLQWADLDLDRGELHVVRNVTEADRAAHIVEPKTAKGKRTVSLGRELAAVLRAHRKAQAADRLAAEDWEDGGWVFCDERGHMLRPYILTHRFKATTRAVPELPEAHLHTLRHTAATTMLLAGVAPRVVADQLGHRKVELTLNVYAHVIQRQRDDSADAVERLYEQSTGTSVIPR